ncbi:DNA (cytosine-5)-methyltransferase 1 [Neolecta irregularis DAH-3]|uniref:DNA (cytosine-5-)-methyltransferase n=1 Tax=Neolecta irregularis (strain DAH-3) TaxID=1198029 RepID=A0A1U7LG73_NEOID|nr:DNA (cytosine-5)-methyltransferase 1 [Neolecta irregularis DAH-3]|eukprot:OLL21656.1 DNA (cytosine-5)-methyltransferase 1 [Neolecta irregularis DAH-3]
MQLSNFIGKSRKNKNVYVPLPEEIEEDAKLVVIGEDRQDETEILPGEERNERETLPCRTLDNFTLYDVVHGNRIVGLESIGDDGMDIRCSGIVKPIIIDPDDEPEDDDDEDFLGDNGEPKEKQKMDQQIVKLSAIFFWEIIMEKSGESQIWLRTTFAYYRLLNPSIDMVKDFTPLARRLQLANLVIATLARDNNAGYEEFIENIKDEIQTGSSSISMKFNEKDIKKESQYLLEEISNWSEEVMEDGDVCDIFGSQLFTKIMQFCNGVGKSVGIASGRRTQRNVNLEVLKHVNPTCVTPWINKVSNGLFLRTLLVSEIKVEGTEVADDNDIRAITCDPHTAKNLALEGRDRTTNVRWIGEGEKKTSDRTYYNTVDIDGDIITVGDCVSMRADETHTPYNKKQGKSAASVERQAEVWFGRVVYMWQEKNHKQFHVRWFIHGSDTVLQETAGPRELFLIDECDDNELDSIMGKIEVRLLDSVEPEPVISKKNVFFYRFFYDKNKMMFEDVRKHEGSCHFQFCDEDAQCESCEAHHQQESFNDVVFLDTYKKCFKYKGSEYYPNDFVYTVPKNPDTPYEVGQIIDIVKISGGVIDDYVGFKMTKRLSKMSSSATSVGVKLRMFKRSVTLVMKDYKTLVAEGGEPSVRDQRQLFYTGKEAEFPATELEGTCCVRHIDEIENLDDFKDEQDTFWVDTKLVAGKQVEFSLNEITHNPKSERTRKEYLRDLKEFLATSGGKLRGLDIFSGAGGLTIGFDRTGAVETKWAIEFSKAAAMAFKYNHPNIMVYNQCANLLLDRAIKEGNGEIPDELLDFQKQKVVPMPARGEVDFIYCGPPCGINRFKKANDVKNSLIATSLSYVDFYRPKYFLLENVRGLLAFRMGGKQAGTNKIEGGIRMGAVKFILRALTSMGYQAQFSIQQAGQHGCPQSRRRVIFWGVQMDYRIPRWPQPSHCFPKQGSLNITLPDGFSFSAVKRRSGHAPHALVTIGDAILDLPGFEYANPHKVCSITDEEQAENRPYRKINVSTAGVQVGELEQDYAYPPLSEYQRWIRKKSTQLTCHFTRPFNEITVERICRIPMIAGADHSSLPDPLKPWCLSDPNSAAARHNGWKGLFGRLDLDSHFQTALTDIQPMGKQGSVIHPTQKRVITVREHARSQGFPDTYKFISDTDKVSDQHRQVGNAVPIPLGFALGLPLRECLIEQWKRSALTTGEEQA